MVWNVGQGQWITIQENSDCVHFDAGGEFAPLLLIQYFCKAKKSWLILTHGDWDHINFVPKLREISKDFCLVNFPREKLSPRKVKFLKNFPMCNQKLRDVRWLNPVQNCKYSKDGNCNSFIIEWQKQVLILGDAPKKAEIAIVPKLNNKLKFAVLGHHGSRTSTSEQLLKHLPLFTQALISARNRRYGHPHREVLSLLRKYKMPTLTSETWGSIIIEL